MTTLGAIIFLLLPSNKVAVQSIFQIITSSERGMAAAMALLLLSINSNYAWIFLVFTDTFPRGRKSMNVKLALRQLTQGYGALPVLRGVDLDVYEGETIAVLGSSGCGKTSLLKAIAGPHTDRCRGYYSGW